MKRLRLHFLTFFALLSSVLGVLLWQTYRQIGLEERELWRGQAEKVYNQMQAAISEFLTAEDRRAFSEYRFYSDLDDRMLPKQPTPFSPIANIPSGDLRGLVGYFQIDPDGSFSTPYLPKNWPESGDGMIADGEPRRKLQIDLEKITSSLKSAVPAAPSKQKGYVELGRLEESKSQNALKNVYPNPIQEQAARYEEKRAKSKSASLDKKDKKDKKAGLASVAQKETEKDEAKPLPAAPAAEAPTSFASGPSETGSAPPSPQRGRRYVEPRFPDDTLNLAIDITGMSPLAGSAGPAGATASDPFQARLVNERYLLFYRKVWKDKAAYVQGFAVELRRFYDWLMEQTFANSEFPDFALTRLEVTDTPVAQYGLDDFDLSNKSPFFGRALGYPLNRFEWKIYVDRLPRVSTRLFLNVLSGILFTLITVGLYLIYRASASQVAFSQKRQDFVSAITHELKTPLTSIRMYSEMLEDGWAQDETKLKEYYGHISKESGRLSRLIENVLQLARLEKKTYKLNLKKEHPSTDFKEMAEELKKIAERQGFSLVYEIGSGVPPIIFDPEAIKQVFLTLLDNSMKFAAEATDKSLKMSLTKGKDEVVYAFRDRGPGIPPPDLKKVFRNFYRVENEMTRKTKGTGIGLAMSRMLAEAMGAHIEARNREGGGLEMRLVFKVFR